MIRQTRGKNFVSGGIYNPGQQYQTPQKQQQQKQQQHQQQKQPQQQQPQQKQQQQLQPQKQQQQQPKQQPQQRNQQQRQQQVQQQVQQQEQQQVEQLEVEDEPMQECEDDSPVSVKDEQLNLSQVQEIIDSQGDGVKKLPFKKIFGKRKKSSVRIKEKKIRQNRQLRKALLPKNALMALNEVKGLTISDFGITNNIGGGYSAVVTVNAKQYEGKGVTKVAAKNSACEKALRDYVIAKMIQKPRLVKPNSSEEMDAEDENVSTDGQSFEDNEDVPMINLASFAIYKLFTEWENEGYVIPELHHVVNPSKQIAEGGNLVPKEPTKRVELPPNWEATHPATLLSLMRPGIIYSTLPLEGEKPNNVQVLSVCIDGQDFVGRGRSKKTARRNCAVEACNTIFGTNFEKDVQ